jgi:hypothetical protein
MIIRLFFPRLDSTRLDFLLLLESRFLGARLKMKLMKLYFPSRRLLLSMLIKRVKGESENKSVESVRQFWCFNLLSSRGRIPPRQRHNNAFLTISRILMSPMISRWGQRAEIKAINFKDLSSASGGKCRGARGVKRENIFHFVSFQRPRWQIQPSSLGFKTFFDHKVLVKFMFLEINLILVGERASERASEEILDSSPDSWTTSNA